MTRLRMVAALSAVALFTAACGAADEAADTAVDRVAAGVAEAPAPQHATQEEAAASADASADESAPIVPEAAQAPGEVTFADHGVAAFADTADLAVSTFQTDADVASFRLAEAWLARHRMLPPAEAVRAEEWVNALDHRYPDPDAGDAFRVVADAGAPWWQAPAGAPQDTVLLRVGVQAAREVARQPVSLTLVVDTSGSMATDDRLGTVVGVVGDLLDRLDERDQVGLVAFDDEARLLLDHTGDLAAVRQALDALAPGGSTNTGAGVVLGHRGAVAAHRPGDRSSVVLFADGAANRGTTDPDAILAELGDEASAIAVHTVGVGVEMYNDALLERLANASSGTYAYVDLPEHARGLFDRDLPVLAPAARDVKAQVAFDPAVVRAWRLVGYENRLIETEAFRDDAVRGGYVGAGHAVTALYELVLDRESAAPADLLGTVRLRWVGADGGEARELAVGLPGELLDREPGSPTFATAAAMGALAEALRGSPQVVVDLAGVAARLEASGDEQDAWLAGVVRTAAAAAQVSSPERRVIDAPGVRVDPAG